MFNPNSTHVLVVDDMMTMRKLVSKVLKDMGFQNIKEAADGALGYQALESANPPIGLVVSDWNMPNCTGLELLKKIRANDKLKNTPFLMVTAEAEQHQVIEAVKAGVDNYVVKPFTPEQIKDKLAAIYKKRNPGG